jgi:hypothetical protein
MMSGLLNEINQNSSYQGFWVRCTEVFDLLPIAALTDKNVFSIHGGLSPQLRFVSDAMRCGRTDEEKSPIQDELLISLGVIRRNPRILFGGGIREEWTGSLDVSLRKDYAGLMA